MRRRHLSIRWLMTDERMGDALWVALDRLPRGSGIVFRHYATADRRALFERVRAVARRRRLVLVLAGPPRLAIAWRADGAHGRRVHTVVGRRLIQTAPCHSRRELIAARGAELRFLSPIHATRSHPGSSALGTVRAGSIVRGESGVVALGGMTALRARAVRAIGFDRWGAIDARL